MLILITIVIGMSGIAHARSVDASQQLTSLADADDGDDFDQAVCTEVAQPVVESVDPSYIVVDLESATAHVPVCRAAIFLRAPKTSPPWVGSLP